MADWFTWANVAKLIPSVPGWIALWRTLRNERTRLKFLILPSESRSAEDARSFTINITVTNEGARPVTLKALRCRYSYSTARGEANRIGYTDLDNKIGLGEACSSAIDLRVEPLHFDGRTLADTEILSVTGIVALDSVGHEWFPPNRQIRKFYRMADHIWHLKRPEKWLQRYMRILRRYAPD